MGKVKSKSRRAKKAKANQAKTRVACISSPIRNSKQINISAVGNMSIDNQRKMATRTGADCFVDTSGNTHLLNDGKWTMQELVIDNDYLKQFKEVVSALGGDTSQYTLESLKAALA